MEWFLTQSKMGNNMWHIHLWRIKRLGNWMRRYDKIPWNQHNREKKRSDTKCLQICMQLGMILCFDPSQIMHVVLHQSASQLMCSYLLQTHRTSVLCIIFYLCGYFIRSTLWLQGIWCKDKLSLNSSLKEVEITTLVFKKSYSHLVIKQEASLGWD